MFQINPVELLNRLESKVGPRLSKLFVYAVMAFAVIYAFPIAIAKLGEAMNLLGLMGMTVPLTGSGGPLPSILDMTIALVYMWVMLAGSVFLTGLMWGLADNITGRLYYRREIREIKKDIAKIKAHLGMEK